MFPPLVATPLSTGKPLIYQRMGIQHIAKVTQSVSNDTMSNMREKIFSMFILMLPFFATAQATSNTETGFEIMTNKLSGNCLACHDLPGVSGVPSNFGPTLHGVGARRTQEELFQWVVDARKINPETLMPPFGSSDGLSKVIQKSNLLSSTQIEKVVSTLQSWR